MDPKTEINLLRRQLLHERDEALKWKSFAHQWTLIWLCQFVAFVVLALGWLLS